MDFHSQARASIIETVAKNMPGVPLSAIIREVDQFLVEQEEARRLPLAPGSDRKGWRKYLWPT